MSKRKNSHLIKPCERCSKRTGHRVDHFSLTGEYLPASDKRSEHAVCRRCWDAILFSREVRRQQREMTASEDELISGDYED